MTTIVLDQYDAGTEVWKKVSAHIEGELARKRQRLENPTIDDKERTALAWQIDTLKKVLAIDGRGSKNVAGAGE